MIRRRHLAPAAAAAAAALLLAGCAGGGGGGDAAADAPPPPAAIPVATGAGAQESATLAIAAMGSPGAVDASAAARTLAAYDGFGVPHDLFAQQVDESAAPAAEEPAEEAAPEAPELPVLVPPAGQAIATPGGTTGGGTVTPPAPAGEAPAQSPLALEADFDVSGEPVVAREGDAIPPETQQFTVETITADSVLLRLAGGLLPDGTDNVTLKEGESVTLYNATAKRSYKIKLVDVRAA